MMEKSDVRFHIPEDKLIRGDFMMNQKEENKAVRSLV